MLFNVNLGTNQNIEQLLISGSSWSNCLSYCEGTGKEIQSIANRDTSIIANNITLGYYFSVIIKNNSTSVMSSKLIFDTFENVLIWVDQQTGHTLQSIIKSTTQFVSI